MTSLQPPRLCLCNPTPNAACKHTCTERKRIQLVSGQNSYHSNKWKKQKRHTVLKDIKRILNKINNLISSCPLQSDEENEFKSQTNGGKTQRHLSLLRIVTIQGVEALLPLKDFVFPYFILFFCFETGCAASPSVTAHEGPSSVLSSFAVSRVTSKQQERKTASH